MTDISFNMNGRKVRPDLATGALEKAILNDLSGKTLRSRGAFVLFVNAGRGLPASFSRINRLCDTFGVKANPKDIHIQHSSADATVYWIFG